MISELRYRAAISIKRSVYAAADAAADKLRAIARHAMHPLAVVRGYGSRLSARITPCGCEATDVDIFCSRKRPPRPGCIFQEPCDCPCHSRPDYTTRTT